MTIQQIRYLTLYEAGYNITQIAEKVGKHRTTVSRVLKKAKSKSCPFSDNCETCPLPDCAIKTEYAVILNKR